VRDLSFGIKLAGLVPSYAASLADLPELVSEFESLGADDVTVGEHILFGPDMRHPGGSGKIVHGRTEQKSDVADALVLFAAIAARTRTIKMCSGVILAAAHPFALLAKQAATLDVISKGRFVLGVGPGWYATEFDAMGVPFNEREARLEETIRACQELWSPGLSTFVGEHIQFKDVLSEPAPWRGGSIPVWWGLKVSTPVLAGRVVELGDGWIAHENASHHLIASSVASLRDACGASGRDPSSVGIRATLTPVQPGSDPTESEVIRCALEARDALSALGVTHFTIPLDSYGLDLDATAALLTALRS
jgi:probable F420-dependent oxidoreductase